MVSTIFLEWLINGIPKIDMIPIKSACKKVDR